MENKYNFNNEQFFAYTRLMTGRNIYLSGGAGVGKSYTLDKFINDSRMNGKKVMITAPTGIAALNVGGVTLNHQFGIPIGIVKQAKNDYSVDEELISTDILIIEEISMCRIDMFEFVVKRLLNANSERKRRGLRTIQFVLVGDFFQLPPVITENDRKALNLIYKRDIGLGFAFQSELWDIFDFEYIILNKVERQSNEEFIQYLNKIRVGEKAYITQLFENSNKNEIKDAITICGKNSEVLEKNTLELNKIDGEYTEYRAILEGSVNDNDTIADFSLKLKVGARVILLVNSDLYKNGSFGKVLYLDNNIITVRTDDDVIVNVERYTWNIYRYELEKDSLNRDILVKNIVGTFTQFPLKLAYAITIHKSQGQTYEKANISPYCWDCGQLYVAISRIKSLDNIHFNYEPDMSYLVISLTVIEFYNKMVAKINKNGYSTQNTEETEETEKKKCSFKDKDIENDMNKLLDLFQKL